MGTMPVTYVTETARELVMYSFSTNESFVEFTTVIKSQTATYYNGKGEKEWEWTRTWRR